MHRANWTVLTAIAGSRSGVSLYFGFRPTQAGSSADPGVFKRIHDIAYDHGNLLGGSSADPGVFKRILQGLLPGLALDFEETTTVETLVGSKRFGGMLSGVPVLKVDDERQHFNLSSVVRSLYSETYNAAVYVPSRS